MWISDVETEFWILALFVIFLRLLLSHYQPVNLSINQQLLPYLLFWHAEARKKLENWYWDGLNWELPSYDRIEPLTTPTVGPRNDACDDQVLQVLWVRVYWRLWFCLLWCMHVSVCVLALAAGFLCLILAWMSKAGDSSPGVPWEGSVKSVHTDVFSLQHSGCTSTYWDFNYHLQSPCPALSTTPFRLWSGETSIPSGTSPATATKCSF